MFPTTFQQEIKYCYSFVSTRNDFIHFDSYKRMASRTKGCPFTGKKWNFFQASIHLGICVQGISPLEEWLGSNSSNHQIKWKQKYYSNISKTWIKSKIYGSRITHMLDPYNYLSFFYTYFFIKVIVRVSLDVTRLISRILKLTTTQPSSDTEKTQTHNH